MSSSVSISIATNTAIAAAKGFGWAVTGSPTLFAETIHSVADVLNQVLLKVGEVRGRRGPDALHPFGRGQEKFFWALVSAVSVFFIGCGLNIYHGIHALLSPSVIEPFTPLVLGLLLFALALESFTFGVALREIGGWKSIARNRNNTTVLAVLFEDAVALLGAMALFLASINRRLLIDISDVDLDRAAQRFLGEQGVAAEVSSVVVDDDHAVVFLRALPGSARPFDTSDSYALGEALKAQLLAAAGKTIDEVYWKFPLAPGPAGATGGR